MNTKNRKMDDEGKVIGPNGEVRPADPLANQTVGLDVLTGHREEEYIDEEHKAKAQEKWLDEKRNIYEMDTATGEMVLKEVVTRRELLGRNSAE